MTTKHVKNEYDNAAEAARLHIDDENLSAKKAKIVELKAQADIRKKYGDGVPYERDRCIVAAKDKLSLAKDNLVAFGKYLIWIQAEEQAVQPAGLPFEQAVQPAGLPFEQIIRTNFSDVPRSTIFNAMRLAHTAVTHPYFFKNVQHSTKMIALLEGLPEEDIQELENGGIVAGIKLDEVDRTPRRELADKIRKVQKQIDRGQIQLCEAEDKIKALEVKIHDLQNPKLFDSKEQELIALISELGMRYEIILTEIKARIPYEKTELPQSALKKLYYLLLYIQKETMDERLRLAEHYDAADEVPWEPTFDELPDDKTLRSNVAHLEPVLKKQAEKTKAK